MNKLIFKGVWPKENEPLPEYYLRLTDLAKDGLFFPSGASLRSERVAEIVRYGYDEKYGNHKAQFLDNFPLVQVETGQTIGLCFDEGLVTGAHNQLYLALNTTYVETLLRMTYNARKEANVTLYLFSLKGEVNVVTPKHHLLFDNVELGNV